MSLKILYGPELTQVLLRTFVHLLKEDLGTSRISKPHTKVTKPHIKVRDLRPVAPSGVALASALTAGAGTGRTCLRAPEPDTWITQTLSSEPCDLFLVVGSNGTSVDQLNCMGCTLRAAHLPDECLTWAAELNNYEKPSAEICLQ